MVATVHVCGPCGMPVNVCDVPATVTPTFVPGPPTMYEPAPATASHVRTTVPSAVCLAVKFAGSRAVAAVTAGAAGTGVRTPPGTLGLVVIGAEGGRTTAGPVGGGAPGDVVVAGGLEGAVGAGD